MANGPTVSVTSSSLLISLDYFQKQLSVSQKEGWGYLILRSTEEAPPWQA